MKFKTYILSSIIGVIFSLFCVGGIVYYVDPYFQYHPPKEQLAYDMPTNDFMYYNSGIAKSYSYDTIITGSSMSRSFLPSYVDEKFNCQSVKLSMAEATGKDFSVLLPVVARHEGTKRIIIGLDDFAFNTPKDYSAYDKPMYLYDLNKFNDVKYLANFSGLQESYRVLLNTKNGLRTTSMDDYQNYTLVNDFSAEQVKKIYIDGIDKVEHTEPTPFHELEKTVTTNLNANLIPIIEENPDIEFVCYFPPYSIVSWGMLPNIENRLNVTQIIIESLMDYENVSLYFFSQETEHIVDLDHYMDTIHYDSEIANEVVDFISDENNKLTKENYIDTLNYFRTFLYGYDYDSLLEQEPESAL